MLLVFKASIVFTNFFVSAEFVLFAILLFWLHHLPSDSIVSAFVNELTDYYSFKLVVVAFNNQLGDLKVFKPIVMPLNNNGIKLNGRGTLGLLSVNVVVVSVDRGGLNFTQTLDLVIVTIDSQGVGGPQLVHLVVILNNDILALLLLAGWMLLMGGSGLLMLLKLLLLLLRHVLEHLVHVL